jgi:hypothetical protein
MTRSLLLSLTAIVAVGCSGNAETRLTLGAKAGSGATASGAALTAGPDVELSRVRMVVDRIKLYRGPSDGSGQSDEVATGPFLLDLGGAALDSGLKQLFTVDVPADTYDRVKIRIHRLEDGSAALPEMMGVAGGAFEGHRVSIRAEGTRFGAPFVFESGLDEEQEYFGTFVMDEGESNHVSLAIDVSVWFLDADNPGVPLDPADPSHRSKIENNIKGSIDAFDDDDRNGRHD